MRVLVIICAVFFSVNAQAQIFMSGTKNTPTTTTSNTEENKVNRTPVEVTKVRVEERKYVILNQIANSKIESSENAVRIMITRHGASTNLRKPGPGEGEMDFDELKKQIIIDLGSPKITRAPVNSQGKPMIVINNNGSQTTTNPVFVQSERPVNAVELVTTPVETVRPTTPIETVAPSEIVTTPVITAQPTELVTTPSSVVLSNNTEPVEIETTVVNTPVVSTPVVTQPVVETTVTTETPTVQPVEVITTPAVTQPVEIVTTPVTTQPVEVITTPVVSTPVVSAPEVNPVNVTIPVVTAPIVEPVEVSTPVVATNAAIDTPVISTSNPGITINNNTTEVENPMAVDAPDATLGASTRSKDDYPKKNGKMWGIGFNAGLPMVFGDVSNKLGYGGSVTIQKPLGHVLSLRLQGLFAETFGQDWKLQDGEPDYKNYKSRLSDYTLQGVFSLNNINFYKRQPKVILNLIAGAGFSTRFSWTNALDENGDFYDYSDVPAIADKDNRSQALDVIKDKLDEGYETALASNKLEGHIKDTDINPTVVLGMGLGFRLSKRVDLNLEQRMSWHGDDMLDAYASGNGNDWLSYTSLGFNFKIGKAEEAMWWMNPVYSTYDDIRDLKKKVDEGDLLTDEDKDGVADIFDKDKNTPEKVAVDTRGVASDLDKDGIADYLDAQPFTPIGAEVDQNGVAIDTDGDGVPDVYDMEMSTPNGAYVDANGRQISGGGSAYNNAGNNNSSNSNSNNNNGGTYTSSGTYNGTGNEPFGMVFFDLNSTSLKKEFYPELYKVVAFVRDNPGQKVVITGYTDLRSSDKYNMGLSERRAQEVYRMLTEVFKVLSTKLEIRYEGENNALIPNLPDPANPKYEAAYYLNRRVTFSVK